MNVIATGAFPYCVLFSMEQSDLPAFLPCHWERCPCETITGKSHKTRLKITWAITKILISISTIAIPARIVVRIKSACLISFGRCTFINVFCPF